MSKDLKDLTLQQLADLVSATFEHQEHKMRARIARIVTGEVLQHLQNVGLLDGNGNAKPVIFRPRAECYPPLVVQ